MLFRQKHTFVCKITLVLISLFMFAAFCGCSVFSKAEDESAMLEHGEDTASAGLRQTTLYFQSDDGHMVPVMKLLPWEEGIGKAALNQLVDSDENRISASAMGLKNVVPQGVTFVLSISDDAVATVNIENLPTLESAEAEEALITAVINTLTEFPTIEEVEFKFDGAKLKKLPNGTKVEGQHKQVALNEEPLPVSSSDNDDILEKVTLYFANSQGSLYVPVTRCVTREPSLELVMKELVIGPVDSSLLNCFPEGTEVLSAEVLDDIATINLSSEFNQLKSNPYLEEIALETMMLTAEHYSALTQVNVQVDGIDYEAQSVSALAIPTFANTFR